MHTSLQKVRSVNDGSMTMPQTQRLPGRDELELACPETRRGHRLVLLHGYFASGRLCFDRTTQLR
jgi:hypothetical protein